MDKVATGMLAAQAVQNIYNQGKNKYNDYFTYTVTIEDDDPIYESIHTWLFSKTKKVTKAIAVESIHRDSGLELVCKLDDAQKQEITVDGHAVKVYLEKGEKPENDHGYIHLERDKIVFITKSVEAQTAVIKLMEDFVKKQISKNSRFFFLGSYGGWSAKSITSPRPLDSVILKEGQSERIVRDMTRFLEAEPEYARLGMPWHRGYLFYGPPGTGKTSFAKALASHFGMDIFYVPLGDIEKDGKLLTIINEVNRRSILLLEDIDVFSAAHDREQEENSLSLSGLLNALDGIGTPEGLITIMTTNNKDGLDDAILRRGRTDLSEMFDLADAAQVSRTYEYFYNKPLTGQMPPCKIAIADVMELFKQHMNDPDIAAKKLLSKEWL